MMVPSMNAIEYADGEDRFVLRKGTSQFLVYSHLRAIQSGPVLGYERVPT